MLCVCRPVSCALGKFLLCECDSKVATKQLPSAVWARLSECCWNTSTALLSGRSRLRGLTELLHLCLSRLSVPFFFLCILHFTERLRCVLKGAATDFDPHSHLDGSLNKSISFSLSISSTMCSMFASTFPQYCSVVHQPRNSFFCKECCLKL